MISVKQLCKQFGQQKVVDNLSFDLAPGDIVGFLGPNGAGKSTTMKMLTGFLSPDSGSIEFAGKSIEKHRLSILKTIGYLPEGAPAYGEMTVQQFLSFIADIRGLKGTERYAALVDVINKVQLGDVLNKNIENLSKGFKRRVGLAQALIHDPDILILDEPTDGLDPNQKQQVRKLIQDLSKEKIVIISTHILEEVHALCNRVMVIAEGQMRFDGTPAEILRRSKAYNAVVLQFSYSTDVSALEDLDGVKEVSVDLKNHIATLYPEDGQSIVHLVSDYIFQRRLPVDQMTVERGHLDDVFHDLTTKAAPAPAPIEEEPKVLAENEPKDKKSVESDT